MLPVGFEPTISEGERPQTYALDRAATGTVYYYYYYYYYFSVWRTRFGSVYGPVLTL